MPPLGERRTDLDGLRGVAILSVVAFHFDERILPGGYAGVDIFFVLSGFLMARGFLTNASKRSFSHFFARRLQRLVPALAACLAVVTIATALIFGPSEFAAFGQRLAAVSVFGGNILLWAQSGYFAPESKTIELLHLWSLGAEGQWYLFVPVLYGLMRLFQTPRCSKWALVLLAVLSGTFAVYCEMYRPSFGFYMFPARLWQFLLGAIVATCLPPLELGRSRRFLSGIGLALVLVPMAFPTATGSFSLELVMLVSLGTATLIAIGLQEQSPAEKGLVRSPLFIFAGRISYAWYLWHWPLLTLPPLFLMRPLDWPEKVIAVLVAACAAWLSTSRLELPILAKPVQSAQRVIVVQLSLMVAFLIIGSAISGYGGFPQRVSSEAASADRAAADFQQHESCATGDAVTCKSKNWSIVVWGDSHAEQWMPAMQELVPVSSKVRLGRPGCPPLPGVIPLMFAPGQKPVVTAKTILAGENCRRENQVALETIEARRDVQTVVLAAAWSFYSEAIEPQTSEGRFLVQDSSGTVSADQSRRLMEKGLGALITRLRTHGKTVWLVGDTPAYREPPSTCLARAIIFDRDARTCSARGLGPKPLLWSNAMLKSLATRHQARVYLPSDILCDPKLCAITFDGHYVYRDADHITSTAAKALGKVLFVKPGVSGR